MKSQLAAFLELRSTVCPSIQADEILPSDPQTLLLSLILTSLPKFNERQKEKRQRLRVCKYVGGKLKKKKRFPFISTFEKGFFF